MGRNEDPKRSIVVDQPVLANSEIVLIGPVRHYLGHVLRMAVGDRIEVTDRDGNRAIATLTVFDKTSATIGIEKISPSNYVPNLTLYQAIPKGNRWEFVLEKAVEVGVDTIVPIETDRSVVRIPDDRVAKKTSRWQKIVDSAAAQSARQRVPNVTAPLAFKDAWTHRPETVTAVVDLGEHPHLMDAKIEGSVGVWVGPEGGWSDKERDAFAAYCYSLGSTTLRSETAGMLATAFLRQSLMNLDSC